MSRIGRVAVGVVVVAVGGLLLVQSLGGVDSESGTPSFSDVAFVEFDLENSPVEFTTGGSEVVVDYTSSGGMFGSTKVTVEQSDDVLHIDQDCTGFIINFGCEASFHVTVPSGVQVSGVTSNGSVALAGLDHPADVATSNGEITLQDLTAAVVARTSNGAITGTGLGSDIVDLVTSNGRITLTFVTSPSSVTLRSSNGALELFLPPDAPPYAVDTSTSNGSVTTDIRTDPSATKSISMRTSNGSITLGFVD